MRTSLLAVWALIAALAAPAGAGTTIVVGAKQTPPFAMKTADGTWTGLSIELWRNVAQDLGLEYTIHEYDLNGLLAAVEQHGVDVGIGAITINAAREQRMDFSHPYYSTGLSIAVPARSDGGTLRAVGSLLTWGFARVVVGLLVLLAASGALVWLFERRRNAAQFGGGPLHGIAAGLWWSAVTMTTVGYGDKAPVTPLGRIIALAWMFIAIIVFSFFTASITSALTVQQLGSKIRGPDDLGRAAVVSVAGSTSAAYLDQRHIRHRDVATADEGIRALLDGDDDAMVYDAALLSYTARSLGAAGDIQVLPDTFRHQDYGFALPEGSPLREDLNRQLLRELGSERWAALREHFTGD